MPNFTCRQFKLSPWIQRRSTATHRRRPCPGLKHQVIIGDVPVSALDVSIQAQIINFLIDLQDEFQLSYIIISHDLAVVEYICDRIAVMYLGKIVEMSAYRDMYANPAHPYTQALLSAVPVPDLNAKSERIILGGDVPSPINPPSGCRFHPRCPRCLDICPQKEPELKDLGDEHWVACHLCWDPTLEAIYEKRCWKLSLDLPAQQIGFQVSEVRRQITDVRGIWMWNAEDERQNRKETLKWPQTHAEKHRHNKKKC